MKNIDLSEYLDRFSLVGFDFDQTLVNSHEATTNCLTEVIESNKENGLDYSRLEDKEIRHLALNQLIASFTSDIDLAEKIREDFIRLYDRKYWEEVEPFPGIRDLLKSLQNSERIMFILSNRRASSLDMILKKTGMDKFFNLYEQAKFIDGIPIKAINFANIRHRFSKIESRIYVGDHPKDCVNAYISGYATVLVDPTDPLEKPQLVSIEEMFSGGRNG